MMPYQYGFRSHGKLRIRLLMNDGMGEYVANQVIKLMLKKGIQVAGSDILILGFTFKETAQMLEILR